MNANVSMDNLIRDVVGLAMKVHRALGPGFLEAVYANSLSLELSKAGISFEREKRIPVFYDNHVVGDFIADLVIDGRLIIEIKAIENLATAHSAQVVNYHTATRIDDGLLINFGSRSLQFKTKLRQRPPAGNHRNDRLEIPLIASQNSVNSV